jgi:hypothetical protein
MKKYHTESRRREISCIKCKVGNLGHIFRRNCLLKHVTEGEIEGMTEVTGRRGRRHKQILDDVTETRGYWK